MEESNEYQEILNRGKEIIREMKEIRVKYYPNNSIESFSPEDKDRYVQLEEELNSLSKKQDDLYWKTPQQDRGQRLKADEYSMEMSTSGTVPKLSKFDLMDSHDLTDNFRQCMATAKGAIDIEIEAIKNGDFDRVKACISVCDSARSNFSQHYWGESYNKNLSDYREQKLGEAHKELMAKKGQEFSGLSTDTTVDEFKKVLSDFSDLCLICNTRTANEEKQNAVKMLVEVVNAKIEKLSQELKQAQEHIELPENETKIEELQSQIEGLEVELEKTRAYSNGTIFMSQGWAENLSQHRKARLDEQGIEMSDIMASIECASARYKNSTLVSRPVAKLHSYQEIDEQVTKKTQYLEKKLAILQKHKDIPGNEKRISEIESQLEQMQDAWVLATSREKPSDIINKNNQKIESKRNKIAELQQKLEMVRATEPQSVGYISNIQNHILINQRDIERLSEQNASLEQNTDKRFMGEHHKKRFEQEEKARAEEQARIKAEQEEKARAEEQARIKAEQEEKARAEEQARIKAEQEAKVRAEEQARIKAEQEAKARAEEQARIKAEQEAKARAEEQARIKAEQEAKGRARSKSKSRRTS